MQVIQKSGRHPRGLVVDLPCTLHTMDTTGLLLIQDVAAKLKFSPDLQVRTNRDA